MFRERDVWPFKLCKCLVTLMAVQVKSQCKTHVGPEAMFLQLHSKAQKLRFYHKDTDTYTYSSSVFSTSPVTDSELNQSRLVTHRWGIVGVSLMTKVQTIESV